ncbi:MAG: hypothetical protein JW863_19845, partial [Chitinispirillaceae bacterium]|nr:hypothetical protein [Chitinispirillaceae bacterium]
MSRTYFVLALANMALIETDFRDKAIAIMDTVIRQTLEIEQDEGQYEFLLDYGNKDEWLSDGKVSGYRSLFVDGEIGLMIAARRLVKEHRSYKEELARRVNLMHRQMSKSPILCGESYPNECWLFCNTVALAAMRLSDVLDGTGYSDFLKSWIDHSKRNLVEQQTGLLISAFELDGNPLPVGACPEGSSIWMACHMLQIVDPGYARDQYTKACNELRGSFLGFGYSREWPESCTSSRDIDSGPVIPVIKASASASG